LLSGCMTIFMLSLAGLPPLAGFFGKFYLFAAALRAGANHGLLWLVALALLGSFVSLYYYLAVLRAVFSEPALSEVERTAAPETGTLNPESLRPINLDFLQRISLVLLAGAVLVLGLLPGGLVTLIAASLAPLQ
jgi:NADH-quinone oxidoreductase subunit N